MSINWIDLAQEKLEDNDEGLSPDELLVQGIQNKDVQKVRRAVEGGANIRQTVNSEKLSIFAMRHFDKDVAEFLIKKGVSFKDVSKIFAVVFEKDDPTAFKWVIDRPNLGILSASDKEFFAANQIKGFCFSANFYKIIASMVSMGCVNCLELVKEANLKDNISAAHVSQGFYRHVWERAPQKITDFLSLVMHWGGEFNNIFYNTSSVAQLSPSVLQALQKFIDANPSQKILPDYAISVLSHEELENINRKLSFDIKKSGQWYTVVNSEKIRSLSDLVICYGSEVCQSLSMTEKGRSVLFDTLSHPLNLVIFTKNAKKDTLLKVLKNNPSLLEWQDKNQNNVMHYVAVLAGLSDKTALDIAAIDMEKAFASNAVGFAPLSEANRGVVAKLSRRNLKAAVKDSVKTKTPVAKLPKRKM